MKILDNPVYIGKIAYGRHKTEKVKGSRDEYKRVKADDYMVVDGMHEAIIDRDLWEATRVRRKETGVKGDKTHSLDHEHISKRRSAEHTERKLPQMNSIKFS